MLIDFQTIPHDEQAYPTVGNWWWENDVVDDGMYCQRCVLNIRVSKLSDPRFELLVFVHELMEALVCREKGVTQEAVDEWDQRYEDARTARVGLFKDPDQPDLDAAMFDCGCPMSAVSEPGNDIHAPYHGAHHLATVVEKLIASVLGVSWVAYDKEVSEL